MKRKICVVITARPSYSRVKTVLEAIKQISSLELQLVVTASALLSKYGQVVNEIENDGFFVDAKVYCLVEGETVVTSAKTTGLAIIELSSIFERLRPDIVVTIADRFETMATAIAAAYMNIPLAHIQGGEVTGNIDEKVRHSITKLADIHFVSTKLAAERVIRMGENPQKVFITGCPSIDIAKLAIKNMSMKVFDPVSKYGGVGNLLDNQDDYIIVMQHPVTTEQGQEAKQIQMTYEAIKNLPIQIYWFWPNVDSGSDSISRALRIIREFDDPKNIRFFKSFSPEDFMVFLYKAKCIVGNSSVAIREASYLGVPAINIGSRQTGRERGMNVVDVGYTGDEIREAINMFLSLERKNNFDTLYGDGHAGIKIAKKLAEIETSFEKKLEY